MPEDHRIPYFLHIDEFQTYATTSEQSFAEILNRFRKLKVGITLAHQVTADIPSKLLSIIVGNAGTVIALKLASEDAHYFARELQVTDRGKLQPNWLQNLSVGEAYARTPSQNYGIYIRTPHPDIIPLQPAAKKDPHAWSQELRQLSKENFGDKRTPPVPLSTVHPIPDLDAEPRYKVR